MNTTSSDSVTLGGKTYQIAKATAGILELVGQRGGSTTLVRNAKHPSMWAHIKMSGYRGTSTWYVRSDDGSFTPSAF
jgi:hypothetical protein